MHPITNMPLGRIEETLSRAWKLAGRTLDLQWDKAKETVSRGISESQGIIGLDMRHLRRGFGFESKPFNASPEISFSCGFERCTWAVHELARQGGFDNLWSGNLDRPWSELKSDTRYNYTLLFLAGNFANNLDVLSSSKINDLKLPEKQKPDSYWDLACTGTRVACENEGTLEWAVRYEIEYAWRNRQVPINWKDSLNWGKVTTAALDAVYTSIESLEKLETYDAIQEMCERLHEHMTHYNLWGKDTDAYRTHSNDSRKYFNDMTFNENTAGSHLDPIRQKENYVLILFATLSAISDYKVQRIPTNIRFKK